MTVKSQLGDSGQIEGYHLKSFVLLSRVYSWYCGRLRQQSNVLLISRRGNDVLTKSKIGDMLLGK